MGRSLRCALKASIQFPAALKFNSLWMALCGSSWDEESPERSSRRPWRSDMKIANRPCVILCLITIGTIIAVPHAYADEAVSNSDIELLRSDIRTQKAALVADRMHFT